MASRLFPTFTAFIMNIQYTIGYVAAGFLVSVPIQLLWVDEWTDLWPSLVRGFICLGGFLIFYPIVRYFDWKNMKLPVFKLFELSVTRNAALVSLALLAISLVDQRVGSPRMLWLLFLLEGIAYVKIKAHTLIFREFYAIEQAQQEDQREWYEELREGLREQASHVGGSLLKQVREVHGQLQVQVRRVSWRMGVGNRFVDLSEPEQQLPVFQPVPCRYGRFGSLLPVLAPQAGSDYSEVEATPEAAVGKVSRAPVEKISGVSSE